MSMKSFDKFCEKIILAEPSSEKEIFDERQKQQRMHLTIEALVIYAVISALLVLFNENIGFIVSNLAGMVLCAAAANLWWVIRTAAKGCLFGVSGKQVINSAIICLCEALVYLFITFYTDDDEPVTILTDGRLTDAAVLGVSLVLLLAANVVVIILHVRSKHSSNKQELMRKPVIKKALIFM